MSCYPNNSCNRNVLKSCSNTDVVVYTGENLTCTGIEYGDSLTVVLQKLDEKYCEILDIIENCNTTTSTTTNTPTPSSCASPFAKILDILEPFEPVPPTTTTTSTTLTPLCCAPTIQSISEDPVSGIITVTYSISTSPECLSCQGISLQKSDSVIGPWFTVSTDTCSGTISTQPAPEGTYFRLIMDCGSTASDPSNVVQI
jgi:hypothetical protein